MNAPATRAETAEPEILNATHAVLLNAREPMLRDAIARQTGQKLATVRAQIKTLNARGLMAPPETRRGATFYSLAVVATPAPVEIPEPVVEVKTGNPVLAASDSEGGEADAPAAGKESVPESAGPAPRCLRCDESDRQQAAAMDRIKAAAGCPEDVLLLEHLKTLREEAFAGRLLRDAAEQQKAEIAALSERVLQEVRRADVARDEVDDLRAKLGAAHQSMGALQEQMDLAGQITARRYAVAAPGGKLITAGSAERAQKLAMARVHGKASRADVFALVPVGAARRGAEWKEARNG